MRLLLVKPSSAAFDSLPFFTQSMKQAFIDLGHKVIYANTLQEILSYKDQCDCLFMFHANTTLELEGQNLFATFHIPIVNFIVDHPHMHHQYLKVSLPDYYVVCLDADHIPYIQSYYPHIAGVTQGWLSAGYAAKSIPFSQKKYPLLFIGSYQEESQILDRLQVYDSFVQQIAYEALEILMEHTEFPIEKALALALETHGVVLIPESFCELNVGVGCILDQYLRAFYRHLSVVSLLQAGIPLTLCGTGWDTMNGVHSQVTCLPPVPFSKSAEVIADAKLVLNINPWFQNGAHDRIFTTLMNQSVCVTTDNAYMQAHFTKEELISFAPNDMETLTASVHALLEDSAKAETMAQRGFARFQADYDVHELAQQILQMVQNGGSQ